MNDQERKELVSALHRQAERARAISALYEVAADTVAGFRTEDEYQALAADAFDGEQSCRDEWSEAMR